MNEDKLQSAISADLFSSQPSIDGLVQVLKFMEDHAQPLSTGQLKAIAYLNYLGTRPLHHGKNPYKPLIDWIADSAIVHSDPGVYLRTIEAVLPVPQFQAEAPQRSSRRGRR